MDLKSYSFKDPYHGYRDSDVLHNPPKEEEKKMSEDDVREAISHYAKMDNDQLMGELMKQVTAQKDKGNTKNMKEIIDKIRPFLNDEQKARLNQITKSMGL